MNIADADQYLILLRMIQQEKMAIALGLSHMQRKGVQSDVFQRITGGLDFINGPASVFAAEDSIGPSLHQHGAEGEFHLSAQGHFLLIFHPLLCHGLFLKLLVQPGSLQGPEIGSDPAGKAAFDIAVSEYKLHQGTDGYTVNDLHQLPLLQNPRPRPSAPPE